MSGWYQEEAEGWDLSPMCFQVQHAFFISPGHKELVTFCSGLPFSILPQTVALLLGPPPPSLTREQQSCAVPGGRLQASANLLPTSLPAAPPTPPPPRHPGPAACGQRQWFLILCCHISEAFLSSNYCSVIIITCALSIK